MIENKDARDRRDGDVETAAPDGDLDTDFEPQVRATNVLNDITRLPDTVNLLHRSLAGSQVAGITKALDQSLAVSQVSGIFKALDQSLAVSQVSGIFKALDQSLAVSQVSGRWINRWPSPLGSSRHWINRWCLGSSRHWINRWPSPNVPTHCQRNMTTHLLFRPGGYGILRKSKKDPRLSWNGVRKSI